MNVLVTGLGQHLDFESKEAINVLTMKLPNGVTVQLPIDDEMAAQFIGAFTGVAPEVEDLPPLREPKTPHEVFHTEEHEEGAVFVMDSEPEAPPPKRTPVSRKSRLVGKDNAGNPVVEFLGNTVGDIADALGTLGDKDEDGVSQL